MKRTFLFSLLLTTTVLSVFAQPNTKYDINGKWYAYDADGKRIENLDIRIFYNEDIEAYYAQYDAMTFVFTRPNQAIDWNNKHVGTDKSKITFQSETSFDFFLKYMITIKTMVSNQWQYQSYLLVKAYTLSLRYIPEKDKLVGRANCEKNYEALGNSDYRSIAAAEKDGKANILTDCEGGCGGRDVVYRRH